MNLKLNAAPEQARTYQPSVPGEQIPRAEDRSQLLALGVEFAQRAARAENFDEICLLLTNDIRSIVEFDRAFLITHMGGVSRFVAASSQIAPEKKSAFYDRLNELALRLSKLDRPILVYKDYIDGLAQHGIDPELQRAMKEFSDFSESAHLLCLPLNARWGVAGHLILEFFDENVPNRDSVAVLGNIEPFLATALAEKWLLESKPALVSVMSPENTVRTGVLGWLANHLRLLVPLTIAAIVILFLVPFAYTVGGEAEIASGERHFAFCKIDGLIKKVFAHEGSFVKQGQPLAVIDPKEIDFSIKTRLREAALLSKEAAILSDGAGPDPTKLAQAELVELKRNKKLEEVKYLRSQRAFLEIRAPYSGVVLTKGVESFAGKKFAIGEPFCEIAVQDKLCAEIYVPDDRITHVKPGQEATVFLNSEPSRGYHVKIREVSPRAEVLPRLGNVFRATADFSSAPDSAMVGMKGIGRIDTGVMSLWGMIAQRMRTRWLQFSVSMF